MCETVAIVIFYELMVKFGDSTSIVSNKWGTWDPHILKGNMGLN